MTSIRQAQSFTASRRQRGISMIELMFVIVLIAIILIASTRQYSKYKMKTNTAMISGSVQTIFDLLKRYYYLNCRTLSRDGDFAVTPTDFFNSGLITPEQYNKVVQDPFGRSNTTAYSFSLNHTLSDLPNPNPYISAAVTYWNWYTMIQFNFPSSVPAAQLPIYAEWLRPSDSSAGYRFNWDIEILGNLAQAGGRYSPISEDLMRFSITQTVPDCTGIDCSKQLYSQDYDASYKPADALQSCEAYEEQLQGKTTFDQRRGFR